MRDWLLANIAIYTVFIVCVTNAAVYFGNVWVLWWYVLLLLIGFTERKER